MTCAAWFHEPAPPPPPTHKHINRVPHQSSSCLGPVNSSCDMNPFLSLSSCWNISSTSFSWSDIICLMSSPPSAPSAAAICFFRYSLTSSLDSCLSWSWSISLNTFVVGAWSPMLNSSTSNIKVAPKHIIILYYNY